MSHRDDIFINLLEKEQAKIWKHSSSIVVAGFVLIVMIVMTINYMNTREQLSGIQTANQQLKAKYSRSLQKVAGTGNDLNREKALRDKEEMIALIERENYSTIKVLEEIENALPQEAVLIEWDIGPEQVALKGLAPAYRSAAELLARLRNGSRFQEVELLSLRYNEQLAEVEFELVLNLGVGRY